MELFSWFHSLPVHIGTWKSYWFSNVDLYSPILLQEIIRTKNFFVGVF
jgi:hypothetical protein